MHISLLPFGLTIAMGLQVATLSLQPRSQVCANDGRTIVGTLFHARALSPTLQPRAMPRIPCFWCRPGTETALAINSFNGNVWTAADAPMVLAFLNRVLNEVRQHLHTNSDGPISGGHILVSKYGASWFAMNEGNHQLTWGVMGAAVEAVTNFMVLYGFGPMIFLILDGPNVVGQGLLQPDP